MKIESDPSAFYSTQVPESFLNDTNVVNLSAINFEIARRPLSTSSSRSPLCWYAALACCARFSFVRKGSSLLLLLLIAVMAETLCPLRTKARRNAG